MMQDWGQVQQRWQTLGQALPAVLSPKSEMEAISYRRAY